MHPLARPQICLLPTELEEHIAPTTATMSSSSTDALFI